MGASTEKKYGRNSKKHTTNETMIMWVEAHPWRAAPTSKL